MSENSGIFYLTKGPTRASRPSTATSRNRPKTAPKSTKIFDLQTLKAKIEELEKKNARISNKITHLQGAMVSQQQRTLLYNDFEMDLEDDLKSLEKRFTKLNEITKEINAFADPTKNTYDYIPPRIEEENYPERTKQRRENEILAQQALYNERKIMLLEMKLKLNHDRRDLALLRSNLNLFEGGGNSITSDREIEENLKIQIENIKMHQNHEKRRIEHEKSPIISLHDAATTIQSLWRGYRYRMQNKEQIEKEHEELSHRNLSERS
ncbi:IQ calmodulin-binding motif family protein [Trichomonas vaginalis G3]|uniref:IQ calmodulin-binding motif family protein n=1 Tax=Trichomonas vaginalis (strain ATCC PRA-98 / G3) TaxID=412133 RepID=A2DGE2_TRIV3|nr:hypothetical protein TVAGG3_0966360 [Trichomonas vaginalis G3]EAY20538.1 IQ calmodulin-binding motif family protein [Trichomonas vaginalis G3]KAI5488270.1 hypothetical protein TVAGG3_0966360 [Trichomonas vaginalis G3]|eukprot:XP_001581524.1 IQ calmodulin-binding motif family protein [Trichomonas vaginalis G3]